MKILLTLILSFQFISAPMAAELGQKGELSMKSVLVDKLSRSVAEDYEQRVRSALADIQKSGPEKFLKTNKLSLEGEDKKLMKEIKGQFKNLPEFVEIKPGHWQAVVNNNKISFSILDLYQENVQINGVALSFKGKSLLEIYHAIETMVPKEKTTWYKTILNNTLFIQEADAAFFIPALLLLAGVIFVAVWINKAYKNHIQKPKETAEKFNELMKKMDEQASQCENAGNDSDAYEATFQNASEIGNSSKLKSITSPSEALHQMLKGQIKDGSFNREDCFTSLAQAGDKMGLKVPDVKSEGFKKRREYLQAGVATPEKDSNSDALIGLCNAYNRLGSCMNGFVGAHVNSSEVEDFQEKASKSFYEFKSSGGATKQ